jgi:secreted PhoX family phosphatase
MAHTIKDDDDGVSNASVGTHVAQIIENGIAASASRRSFLKTGAGLSLLSFLGLGATACGGSGSSSKTVAKPSGGAIGVLSVPTSSSDSVVVADGYGTQVLLRWGDPVLAGAAEFVGDASEGWAEQELQAGDNHDAIVFFPFAAADGKPRSDAGLLCINHEYINPEYFFSARGESWYAPLDADMVKKMLAAHGVSVIEVRRSVAGGWEYVRDSGYNRRITGYTPIDLSGPAAGDPMLQTAADPTGVEALGTLNNCGGGKTPWSTYLTCEENFNGYFGTAAADFAPTAHEGRYGLNKNGFGYLWHTADPRFDLAVNRNEPNRFGWVVEIDPFNPASKPKKRTALGRFKHENAECVLSTKKRAVVYMGCDERNEYLYKFVSAKAYDPANPASGANLLDAGTLYVARLDAHKVVGDGKGTGQWIALEFGKNGLTPDNGFASQAEVLIRARAAADRVGATMMDRPEWIAANPLVSGEVYLACTNNSRRGSSETPTSNKADGTTVAGSARPAVDEANPRALNSWGHIVRWNETDGDPAATTFAWDIFLLAGNPGLEGDKAGSSIITLDNMFNSPDGIQFDPEGRLWIQTDGSFSNTGNYAGQGNNQMLVADVRTGQVTRFLTGPSGCEITGATWTPDGKTAFINIQHPGEVGSHPNRPASTAPYDSMDAFVHNNPTAFSRWPDGDAAGRPRSATVVISKSDGGVIGT